MQPYFDWREPSEIEDNFVIPYIIRVDEDTRIRVYGTQLMDTVIDNITLSNYLFQVNTYHKLASDLLLKFPHREEDIIDATILFLERAQTKLKKLKNDFCE